MRTFLISPVRGLSPDTHKATVERLEAEGWTVHWPARDTDQNDPVGLRICTDNVKAISEADAVHVIWDGKSQGALFDLGAGFALQKKIIPIELPEKTEGKSFQNMIRAWSSSRSPGQEIRDNIKLQEEAGRRYKRPNGTLGAVLDCPVRDCNERATEGWSSCRRHFDLVREALRSHATIKCACNVR